MSAVRTGLRHAVYNKHLRATLVRTIAVYPFACAFLALLPLVARHQMTGGPEVYGILLAAVSVGAIVGSFALAWLKKQFGPDRVVALGTVGIAVALALFGFARFPALLAARRCWRGPPGRSCSPVSTYRLRSPCRPGCEHEDLRYSSPSSSDR